MRWCDVRWMPPSALLRGDQADALRFDAEGAVEFRGAQLPADRGRQRHDSVRREVRANLVEHCIRYAVRLRDGICVGENRFLSGAEVRAGRVRREPMQLLVGRALLSANGRVDLNSEPAPDQRRDSQIQQRKETRRDALAAVDTIPHRPEAMKHLGHPGKHEMIAQRAPIALGLALQLRLDLRRWFGVARFDSWHA